MICSNVSPESLGGIDRAAADLRELGERAAKRGLRIAFEALAWGRHINDYRDAWEAVRRADHPAVGLVLDSFHILARGTDLGDHPLDSGRPHLPGAARRRAAAADGLPLVEPALPQLPRPGRAAGARLHGGAVRRPATTARCRWRSSTTSSAPARRAASPSTAIARCASCSTSSPSGPASAGWRAGLPPRSQAEGVGFIEFSADDHDAPRLEEPAGRARASAAPASIAPRP